MNKVEPTTCIGERYIIGDNDILGNRGVLYGEYYKGDVLHMLPSITDKYRGRIQLIYMDPPFITGQSFSYQQKIGKRGWEGDKEYTLSHIAYTDRMDKQEFLSMMEQTLEHAYDLLSPEGCLYLHIDYRTSAYMRILLDKIFGEDNFLNEIIWHYRSGGRAKKHYSRKHDTILFYRKSPKYYFNIEAIGKPRGKDKKNNMKRSIDQDGRVYWSIKSAGKEYRYYEDEKIYPSDVWDDISHLHQKDPERTGYDTQKPEALLDRIILASSRPEDIVADFFAGSGTTLAVAQKHKRSWLGIDSGNFSIHICRKRMLSYNTTAHINFYYDQNGYSHIYGTPQLDITCEVQNSKMQIYLNSFWVNIDNSKDLQPLDCIDYWSLGYINENIFHSITRSFVTGIAPKINNSLTVDLSNDRDYAIHIADIYGNQHFYKIV